MAVVITLTLANPDYNRLASAVVARRGLGHDSSVTELKEAIADYLATLTYEEEFKAARQSAENSLPAKITVT